MRKNLSVYTCIISLILFIILSVNVVRGNLSAFNDFIYSKISPSISPILTNGLIFISHMGEWYVYGSITILLLLIPKTRKKWGIPVALTISGSAVLNQVLKHFFAIPRPDINRLVAVSGYGYPSGHAMNAMAFVGICLFLFLRASHDRNQKIIISALSVLFIALMGFSRIYLGVHVPAEILAGYIAGISVVSLSMIILREVRL